MKGLTDQSFLVTGGGSGIGRGTCERLCEAGARIAVVDLVEENASNIADSLRDRGAKAVAIGCDVVDESAVISMVQTATSTLGDLRGVVTSAGVNLDDDRQPLPEASVDAFDRVLSINLTGTFTVAKHTIPLLVDGGGGSFVMISSVAGMRGGAGEGFGYTASKGGVIALGQHLAARFGKHGVRVNSVCPGATSGEGMGAFFRTPEAAATVSRAIPMARVGTSEEIGAVAAFLLSDEASYLSGQFFAVDGGATAR
jgi:NAD(P)-dependent dehydrogenase (short-subunit alcohol dehydrogenase family)